MGAKKIIIGENDLWTTHPEIAKLLKNPEDGYRYSYGSHTKLNFICNECGTIQEKSVNKVTTRGFRCIKCGDKIPLGEKILYSFLSQYTNDIEREKIFDWANDKKYDFYTKKYNIICEVFGSQHYKNEFNRIKTSKRKGRSYEEEHKNDILKFKLAKKHNFNFNNYIIINSSSSNFDIIKNNIIKSKLSKIFDITKCDWDKIFKESMKSNVIRACELYNSGIKTTNEISKILNLSQNTVLSYLKQCSKNGWCDYDPKIALYGHTDKAINKRKKKVICITTMRIFNSCSDGERFYSCCKVSECCRGNRKSAGVLQNGTKLVWLYYEDYLNKTEKEIEYMIKIANTIESNKIICLNTKKIFQSFADGAREYNLKSQELIKNCCENKRKYYGTYKNKKLEWMYYKDYLKIK